MLLHVLGHVDADHVGLVVEHELGQSPGQFSLAHTRRPQEDEAADGALGVAQPGAGAADGLGHRNHRLVLADHPPVQVVLHVHQALALTLQQPPGGDAGPTGNQLSDVQLVHDQERCRGVRGEGGFLLTSRSSPFVSFGLVLLLQPHPLGANLGGALVVRTLGRRLLLIGQPVDAFLHGLEAGGQAFGVDTHLAGGLVDEVHRFVGHLPPRDVAVAEPGGGHQGVVGDVHLVMGLVAGPKHPKDLNRFVHRRFIQVYGLKAAF